jgi:hypothetical protein
VSVLLVRVLKEEGRGAILDFEFAILDCRNILQSKIQNLNPKSNRL